MAMMAARMAHMKAGAKDDSDSDDEKPQGPKDPFVIWHTFFRRARNKKYRQVIDDYKKHSIGMIFVNWFFIIALFQTISHTICIQDLSRTYVGIENYIANEVTFYLFDGNDAKLENAATIDDAMKFSESLITGILSSKSYNENGRQEDELLMLLRVHRIINSIVLVQRRVEPTDCSFPIMRPLYRHCYEGLEDHEVTGGTYMLTNGVEVPWSEQFQGYAVELPLNQEDALEGFKEIKEGRFVDRATRYYAIMFAISNQPGHYSGNIKIEFHISPFGYVKAKVRQYYLRLKPYSKEVNGMFFLAMQICLGLLWLFLFGIAVSRYVFQPHVRWVLARFFYMWSLVELACHCCIIYALVMWIGFLMDDRRINMDFTAPEYQNLEPLAMNFQNIIFAMTAAMLLWTVRLIEFFSSVPSKQANRTAKIVEAIVLSAGPFAGMVCLTFVGFIFAAHIFFGPLLLRFDSEWDTMGTLMLWFMTLGSGQRELYDKPAGPFFLAVFVMFGMIVLLNILMAVVMQAHDSCPEEDLDKIVVPFNHRMADKICDALGVRKFYNDPYKKFNHHEGYMAVYKFFGTIRRTKQEHLEKHAAIAGPPSQQPAPQYTSSRPEVNTPPVPPPTMPISLPQAPQPQSPQPRYSFAAAPPGVQYSPGYTAMPPATMVPQQSPQAFQYNPDSLRRVSQTGPMVMQPGPVYRSYSSQ